MAILTKGTYQFNDILTLANVSKENELNCPVNFTLNTTAAEFGVPLTATCSRIFVHSECMSYRVEATEPDMSAAGITLPQSFPIYAVEGYRDYNFNGWNMIDFDEGIKTITVLEDTVIPDDFAMWFLANATKVSVSTIKAGTWRFNDILTKPNGSTDLSQDFNFIYSESNVCGIDINIRSGDDPYFDVWISYGDVGAPIYYQGEGWVNGVDRTLILPEAQEVSADFYEWFTANAVEQKTIKAGTYRFNDVLTLPSELFKQAVNFSTSYSFNLVDGAFVLVDGELNWCSFFNTKVIDGGILYFEDTNDEALPVYSTANGWNNVGALYASYGFANTEVLNGYGQTITIPNDTDVSAEFYEWFTANAEPVADEAFVTIKAGTYRFNDVLTTVDDSITQEIEFSTSSFYSVDDNGSVVIINEPASYAFITVNEDGRLIYDNNTYTLSVYNTDYGWNYYSKVMEDRGYSNFEALNGFGQIITIPNDQEVSAEFGTWFYANAVEQKEISGKWKFNDVLTAIPYDTLKMGYYTTSYEPMITTHGADIVPIEVEGYSIHRISPLNTFGDMYENDVPTVFYEEAVVALDYDGTETCIFAPPEMFASHIDFGTELQLVSAEFYNWLTENATIVLPTISGTWKFKTVLTTPITDGSVRYINEEVSFISNNDSSFNVFRRFIAPTSGMAVEYANMNETSADITMVYADGEHGESTGLSGWRDELDRTITFSSEQEVSEEFYNWFTANAYSLTNDKDYLIKYSTLAFIADSIKIKTKKDDKMTPLTMPNEILSIQTENTVAYNGEVEVK